MAPQLDRHIVTAVLVTHDGARWLPETLKALLTQSHPVDRLVAADIGSTDAGPAMLTEVVGEGNLITLPARTRYADAVTATLAHPASTIEVPDGASGIEWVWLLHDDSAPAPDALERLLATAEEHPPATILGPKLRDWDDRRVLLEAGIAIDRTGRRETGLDPREFDQGQHDTIREVMAVSTAGMLVRRDVWDELGGLDPAFGLFRDDVDFGWRAYAAGHRVLIAPDAVAFHAEASARGARQVAFPADDRRSALLVLLANLPLSALALSLPFIVLTAFLR
ncbi:glycosyltransferase family 2 protein, partial [Actinoallomurus acaciae]